MNKIGKKNIIALCFIGFYTLILALDFDFNPTLFSNLRYAINSLFTYFISLVPLVLIILFMLPLSCRYKKWFAPVSFGIIAFKNLYIVLVSIIGTPKHLLFESGTAILSVSMVVLMFFNMMCFIGTLFDFKFAVLLKLGSLGYILTNTAMSLYDFILLGGMDYINSIPQEFVFTGLLALIKSFSLILFYVGIFIADFNQKAN